MRGEPVRPLLCGPKCFDLSGGYNSIDHSNHREIRALPNQEQVADHCQENTDGVLALDLHDGGVRGHGLFEEPSC